MCRLRGVGDPLKLHPSDFCDVVYAWLVENADEKSKAKFDSKLWMPPNDEVDVSDHPMFSPEAELAALEQGIGGGPSGSWDDAPLAES
jgi:hypothetical protein